MAHKQDAKKRFWSKVTKSECGCWLWNAGAATDGYGSFWLENRNTTAHRASWTLNVGPIPNGLHVLHKCDIRHCVNPDHLYLGTEAENTKDKLERKRQARGEKNGNAKLSERQVREIRQLLEGGLTQPVIAHEFGVSRQIVSCISRGENWRWLT